MQDLAIGWLKAFEIRPDDVFRFSRGQALFELAVMV
jgi:hypothetical protein